MDQFSNITPETNNGTLDQNAHQEEGDQHEQHQEEPEHQGQEKEITQIPEKNEPVAEASLSKESQIKPDEEKTILSSQSQQANTDAITKKKDDDKTGIYKALAIKLKKELVKTRDELQRLKVDNQKEKETLTNQLKNIEVTLNNERISQTTTRATLEATVRNLKNQLQDSDDDLKSLQIEFENYKVRASQIMQQTNSVQSNTIKTFEEERYKQLKMMNEEQRSRITYLEKQLEEVVAQNRELELGRKMLQEKLELAQIEVKNFKELEYKCTSLGRENENLKCALKQYGSKLKDQSIISSKDSTDEPEVTKVTTSNEDKNEHCPPVSSQISPNDVAPTRVSPSASVKDDCHTNSSSSIDGSTSGYVHIKPTTFEIISRSSLLEDAQNQIDNLTKAYLDSESTNSLLSEQVRALKEEIRRIQRGTERMDLAENLEYLKNVVFKFLSLDSNHPEQRQQLIPVLSTVLKLSPDEHAKLMSLAVPDRPSMASTLFKLGSSGG